MRNEKRSMEEKPYGKMSDIYEITKQHVAFRVRDYDQSTKENTLEQEDIESLKSCNVGSGAVKIISTSIKAKTARSLYVLHFEKK